jgi:pilus assembly protein CpaE
VNRYEQRLFGPGLRRGDVDQAFGADLATTVPNSYRLVREAIDRGVPLDEVQPGNKVTQALKKLIVPVGPAADGGAEQAAGPGRKLAQKLATSWAR